MRTSALRCGHHVLLIKLVLSWSRNTNELVVVAASFLDLDQTGFSYSNANLLVLNLSSYPSFREAAGLMHAHEKRLT
jgi:hypothetical protein